MTAVVLDAGGHVVVVKRADGSGIMRPELATAKAAVAGSAFLRDANGEIIGAVGVSGDTSDNDEAALIPAVLAAGLIPDIGDPLPK